MDNTKCNGWSNYATWRVNLEILSDHDFAQQVLEGGQLPTYTDLQDIVNETLFGEYRAHNTLTSTLTEDYARAFLDEVNYHEILEHILEEIEMNEDYLEMIKNYE